MLGEKLRVRRRALLARLGLLLISKQANLPIYFTPQNATQGAAAAFVAVSAECERPSFFFHPPKAKVNACPIDTHFRYFRLSHPPLSAHFRGTFIGLSGTFGTFAHGTFGALSETILKAS